MQELDMDGDGKLSLDEIVEQDQEETFREETRKMFEKSDTNSDNKLDLAELPALLKAFEENIDHSDL